MAGVSGRDHLSGGAGNDAFLGGAQNDVVQGGTGSDIVEGGGGNDRLHGGGQTMDILAHVNSPVPVDVRFSLGKSEGQGTDTFDGFDTVIGSNFADTLVGARGTQWFVGLQGADRVAGGDGRDGIFYTLANKKVDVNLRAVNVQARGEGRDRLSSIEIVFGSPFGDTITGDRRYNVLFGDDGDDVIAGYRGKDTIDGGDGSDMCSSGFTYLNCENHVGPPALPSASEPTPPAPPG